MTLPEQAEYYRLLLLMGLSDRAEVIAWADQLVLNTTAPIEIIDISLAANNSDDWFVGLLKAVRGEADLTLAAHTALSRLARRLHELPLEAAVAKVDIYGRMALIPEIERDESMMISAVYDVLVDEYGGSVDRTWRMLKEFVEKYALGNCAPGR